MQHTYQDATLMIPCKVIQHVGPDRHWFGGHDFQTAAAQTQCSSDSVQLSWFTRVKYFTFALLDKINDHTSRTQDIATTRTQKIVMGAHITEE